VTFPQFFVKHHFLADFMNFNLDLKQKVKKNNGAEGGI
jgi:hypothetical protein